MLTKFIINSAWNARNKSIINFSFLRKSSHPKNFGTTNFNMTDAVITIRLPDDFHHHFRDGEALKHTVPHAARRFRRAVAMPNLKPPITSISAALEYRTRILSCVPQGLEFEPLMTLYLTDQISGDEIRRARDTGFIHAVKLYPAGATTNSDSGVTDINKVHGALEVMQEIGMPLLIHGEVTSANVDIFDKEAVFISEVMIPLVARYPSLKVVMEHITTTQAMEFVMSSGPNVAATITPQHLLYNRNEIFKGGIRPHMYCLPILKREEHRQSLITAATSGNAKFFLGTDSAPHSKMSKESNCGCAGIFSGHAALELYAEVFEDARALDKFEAFCSEHGANFYGLPLNQGTLSLHRKPWYANASYEFGSDEVIPLRAGEEIQWKIKSVKY